jgi:prolyl oligopeptidase
VENAYTQQYLNQVKTLPQTREQISRLLRVDSVGVPQRRGERYFFGKRLAAENQASIYMRIGLHGADERLIDGNKLSADQNTSVTMLDLTQDGAFLTYGIRVGGADELEVRFLDLNTRKEIGDVLPSARYYDVRVSPGHLGAYYSKFFPHIGTVVFYHAFGKPATSDVTIFGREYKGEKLGEIDNVYIEVTENGHYLVLSVGHGVPAKREDVLIKDLRVANAKVS